MAERRDQGMSWKGHCFSLFQQIETYADIYVILMGIYAVIPIAIAAVGPCNFRYILLLLSLVSPPFLLSYIAKKLKLYNEKGADRAILIIDVFLEIIYPIEIGAIASFPFYKALGLSGAAYGYFIGELLVLWIAQLSKIVSTIFAMLMRRILSKIKRSKTAIKVQGKSEPLVIKYIKYIILAFIIIALMLGVVGYLLIWNVICYYSK